MATPLFGEKLQAPPAGNPAVHAMETVPGLKLVAVRCVVAAFETLPVPMVTAEGVKEATLNCTTCSTNVWFFVTLPAFVLEVASRITL